MNMGAYDSNREWALSKAGLRVNPRLVPTAPDAYKVEILGGDDLVLGPDEAEALGRRLIELAKEAREAPRRAIHRKG